jgi:hypothetical protein
MSTYSPNAMQQNQGRVHEKKAGSSMTLRGIPKRLFLHREKLLCR